jgi:hypothetical protein
MSQSEVLLPRESSLYSEPPLLHLKMSLHRQTAPADHETEIHAAGDAVRGGNPAAVMKITSSPPRVTFTRSDRYLDTVPEHIICTLPYLSDPCGFLDDGLLKWQRGPIDKQCRTELSDLA